MQVQDQINLYYALGHAIANSRGYTLKNLPVGMLDHAYTIAHNASKLAVDKWYNQHQEEIIERSKIPLAEQFDCKEM